MVISRHNKSWGQIDNLVNLLKNSKEELKFEIEHTKDIHSIVLNWLDIIRMREKLVNDL